MAAHSTAWFNQLLDWALQGLVRGPARVCPPVDAALLARAYRECAAVTREHSRTFHLASALLPGRKRRAMRALYGFCRVSDDIVDHPGGDARASLVAWRKETVTDCPEPKHLVAIAWADTQASYGIPMLYADQLIQGLEKDLARVRYGTFAELTTYCYGVASTVGLMAMHIVGFAGTEAVPYAVKLGVALQFTNILRDIGEDWRAGRLYLPLQDLAQYGLSEADVARGQVDDRWRAFMRAEIARVRELYQEALPGVRLLNRDGRLAIAAAAELYRAIMEDIEAHDMDVFTRRAHISTWGKLRRLPGIFWRAFVT